MWPLFLGGAIGGVIAYLIGLPMPFMLGGITGAAVAVAVIEARQGQRDLRPPKQFRNMFVALIGAMIGSSFSPEILNMLPAFWPSAVAIIAFILLAQMGGYVIMRRAGGYNKAEALYGSMPGGLVEAAILGEKFGADPKIVSVQHFIRIILVVFTVPLLFWVITGQVVGSAGGQSFETESYTALDVVLIVSIALTGMIIGAWARFPASQLMGPMLLSALLHLFAIVDVSSPSWLLFLAQLVVGVGLGAQFSGLTGGAVARGLKVGVVLVGFMLCLAAAIAFLLAPFLPTTQAMLFLAFAPGGVTEMSLIALSLQVSPVLVAMHHLIRIGVTVFVTQFFARRYVLPTDG